MQLAHCDILLAEALEKIPTRPFRTTISYVEMLPFEVKPGSVTAQLGIRMINSLTMDAPRARLINQIWKLNSSTSPIYALEVDGANSMVGQEIPTDLYHFLLSQGYLPIVVPESEVSGIEFVHDIRAHVVGFYLLSKRLTWRQAMRTLHELRMTQKRHMQGSPIWLRSRRWRMELANVLEVVSTRISEADRAGLPWNHYAEDFDRYIHNLSGNWNAYVAEHAIDHMAIDDHQEYAFFEKLKMLMK